MNTIHIEVCPVCSANKSEKSLVCEDYLLSKESFSIHTCLDCGFAFTQDFPTEDLIGKYYEASDYVSHSDTHKGIINGLYHYARAVALRSKTKLIQKYASTKTGTLLDVGCGTGYFLNSMREKEWIVTGIEKSQSTRDYAHKKFGLNIQDSDYIHQISDKTKNSISLWHALEHIQNLNETMATFYRILKDDGTLFIALPNKSSVDACYYQNKWAAYDVPRHLWHFSPPNFQLFAEKHNFELLEIKPMYFDPLYISMLSEKNKGTFAGSLIGLIKGTLFCLQSFFNAKKCSSVIYILKKK